MEGHLEEEWNKIFLLCENICRSKIKKVGGGGKTVEQTRNSNRDMGCLQISINSLCKTESDNAEQWNWITGADDH